MLIVVFLFPFVDIFADISLQLSPMQIWFDAIDHSKFPAFDVIKYPFGEIIFFTLTRIDSCVTEFRPTIDAILFRIEAIYGNTFPFLVGWPFVL